MHYLGTIFSELARNRRMLHEGVVPEDLAYDAAMSSLRSKWRAALECCDRRGSTHAESVVFVMVPVFEAQIKGEFIYRTQ